VESPPPCTLARLSFSPVNLLDPALTPDPDPDPECEDHGTVRKEVLYLHPSSLKSRSSAFFSPSPRFIPHHHPYYRVRDLFLAFNYFARRRHTTHDTRHRHDTAPRASGQPNAVAGLLSRSTLKKNASESPSLHQHKRRVADSHSAGASWK